MTFDFDRIVSTLSRHGVAYVLIGGAAAVAHGSTLATEDVDLTPARDQGNLDRLGEALLELRARLRTANEPDGVEFPCNGRFLAAMPTMLNLTTDAGDIDLASRRRASRMDTRRSPLARARSTSGTERSSSLPPSTTSSPRNGPPTDPRIGPLSPTSRPWPTRSPEAADTSGATSRSESRGSLRPSRPAVRAAPPRDRRCDR